MLDLNTGVHMIRRTLHLAALCGGAMLLGTFLVAATNPSRCKVRSAYVSETEQAPGQAVPPEPTPSKGAAGARCKVTKDCQPSLICIKVGERKECTAASAKIPRVPLVT